jgi:hypothetical protein
MAYARAVVRAGRIALLIIRRWRRIGGTGHFVIFRESSPSRLPCAPSPVGMTLTIALGPRGAFLQCRWIYAGVLIVALVAALAWVVGDRLSAPVLRTLGDPPADLGARNVEFQSSSGSVVHGWLSRGLPGQGAILLIHGVRGDRRDMLSRAGFLHQAGYTVLLIDLWSYWERSFPQIASV